jgi:hypothetical protein
MAHATSSSSRDSFSETKDADPLDEMCSDFSLSLDEVEARLASGRQTILAP